MWQRIWCDHRGRNSGYSSLSQEYPLFIHVPRPLLLASSCVQPVSSFARISPFSGQHDSGVGVDTGIASSTVETKISSRTVVKVDWLSLDNISCSAQDVDVH